MGLPWRLSLLVWALALQAVHAQGLPAEVDAALARAKIPRDAVSMLVQETGPGTPVAPRLNHRSTVPMNPASVMKLVTTYAALDLLGPAFTWSTPVYLDGTLRDGTFNGHVYIKGQGDPKLVLERLWLLLRRLQGVGVTAIAGDIVLDRSAFDLPEADPALFDGEPLRPYNAAPDALLINYKALALIFSPEHNSSSARVQVDPPLAGVQVQTRVPLSSAECGDYRGALKADFSDPRQIRFGGTYAAACGEKLWPVAYADPKNFALRAVQGMWQEIGGKLGGAVRYGVMPPNLLATKPAFESVSAPLAEVIRDINKYSNNVMAQQLFLTLGRIAVAEQPTSGDATAAVEPALSTGSFTAARAVVRRWWKERISADDVPVLDNGSGLSRVERISTQALARLLHRAYQSPFMAELMASLPITGVDGTLKRSPVRAFAGSPGGAHLKTGSLSNTIARAGYVDGVSGKRYVLAAIINHANANTEAARAAMEALVDWTMKDGK